MRIVIIGATGFIGGHIARRLAADGHDILPVARDAAALARQYPGRSVAVRDLGRAVEDDWYEVLVGADAVVNTVGIIRERGGDTHRAVHAEGPARLFRAAVAAAVPRLIHVSAIGADPESSSVYLRTKGQAEVFLDTLASAHPGLTVTILRPSLVYGPGGGSTALFAALAALPVVALPDGGGQSLQPVHVDDLAAAVAALVATPLPWPRRLDVVGPQPITYAGMLAAYGRWLGRRRIPMLAMPGFAMAMVTWLGERFTDAPVTRDTWRMLRAGNTGDAAPLTRLLGLPPLDLDHGLARHPATAADRRQARLYPLVRPLRWSSAFLWVFSGLASLGLYPVADSLDLLATVGIVGPFALPLLEATAALDVLVGLLLLDRRRVVVVGALSIGLIVAYTAILSIAAPEFWLHPFGPIAKNVPLVAATLAVMAWEA